MNQFFVSYHNHNTGETVHLSDGRVTYKHAANIAILMNEFLTTEDLNHGLYVISDAHGIVN
jgi:hypothetical protein